MTSDPPGVVDLCRRLHPRLVRSLSLYCGNTWVAEELAQETLVRVWTNWRSVSGTRSPEPWAYRVAFNLANSWVRRRAAERRAERRLALVRATPVDGVTGGDEAGVLAAVAGLAPRQRAVVILRFYEDRSVAETAEILGCAPGTVKALTSQGIGVPPACWV